LLFTKNSAQYRLLLTYIIIIMTHLHQILPPEILPTETCVKMCEGKWIVTIFRDLCLGSIDIDERKKLCDKIRTQMMQISHMLGKEQKKVFLHYMNNLTQAYTFLAVEYPVVTWKSIAFHQPSNMQMTACDLHRIVYWVVKLFDIWSPEEKLKFFDRLSALHKRELLQSSHAVLDALETAYKE
jgi:hypothetical protein